MYTSQQISQIMSELGLDPADPASRKTIERLVESKPEVPVDSRFIASLREDLQAKATHFTPKENINTINQFISSFMNKVLASALVVAIALAAGGLWYIQNRTDQPLFTTPGSEAGQLLSGKYAVSDVREESFGDLNRVSIVTAKDAANLKAQESTAVSNNGPGAGGGMAPGAPTADSKLIAPGEPYPYYQYTFKYDGEALPVLTDTQSVLKRTQPRQNASIVSRIISMLSFGLVDLNKFQDMKLQSFSFLEDREFGYNVNVDMVTGSVNIGQNWERWPQPESICIEGSPYCGPQPRITLENMPINADVFKATDKFLEDYGISREAYGSPTVVDSNWRILYEQASAADRANFYFPEQIQVVYPLILDGRQVLDESGNPNGLTLSYDIRSQRVVYVYELTTKQFEKSEYKGVTDANRIIEVAERGGFRNYTYNDPNAQTRELSLGTPTLRLVKLWYSAPNDRMSYYGGGELYVPALVFPIRDWEKSGYWRSSVTVPLVKDILDSDVQAQPMPVDLPAQGNSSSGATEPAPAVVPSTRN